MSGPMAGLPFLRPYAARSLRSLVPTSRSQAAYLRFYQASLGQPTCAACVQAGRRAYGTAERAERTEKTEKTKKTDEEVDVEDRSAVALRIRELQEADALRYPRYEPQAERLSVPEFRRTFAGVEASSSSSSSAGAEPRRVELSGRVLSVQRLGAKLFFFKLLNEGEQVQVMNNLRAVADTDDVAAFKTAARLLRRGDHVAVTGRATRTATGELTLAADALVRVLSPALAPLPTRLLDGDTRALRRHIDLLVNPAAAAAALRLRARLVHTLRSFLEEKRFVEVQTPILAPLAGGAVARPFVTAGAGAGASAGGTTAGTEPLSLRIAPELWLKRLVVGGLDRVFEIGPSFRNEGIDATHNPEFTTCEFYAAYWTLPRLMAETEQLLVALAQVVDTPDTPESPDGPQISPSVALCAAGGPFARLEFLPAIQHALGFALPDLDSPDAYEQLRTLLLAHDHSSFLDGDEGSEATDDGGGRLAKLLDRLASGLLEARSAADSDGPLFIVHHPACMSPLAKSFVCAQTGQRVAARAELFVDGRELANMYEEENDPAEQRRKMERQVAAAVAAGGSGSVDTSYVAALESGLPPTGGWGCGIERLVMLFSGQRRIADCLSFGTLRHVVAMAKQST